MIAISISHINYYFAKGIHNLFVIWHIFFADISCHSDNGTVMDINLCVQFVGPIPEVRKVCQRPCDHTCPFTDWGEWSMCVNGCNGKRFRTRKLIGKYNSLTLRKIGNHMTLATSGPTLVLLYDTGDLWANFGAFVWHGRPLGQLWCFWNNLNQTVSLLPKKPWLLVVWGLI